MSGPRPTGCRRSTRRCLVRRWLSSASGSTQRRVTGPLEALPAGLKSVSADQNFELSLSSLRNANAEVSLLSSLVSSVRKDVSEELSVSKTAQAVSDAYTSKTKLADDLEQYLADAGKPVSATELGVDGGANVSGKSYIAEMENLESASQEFLNIMRQLFAEELDSVAERQQQKPAEEDQKEVAKDETEEEKQRVRWSRRSPTTVVSDPHGWVSWVSPVAAVAAAAVSAAVAVASVSAAA